MVNLTRASQELFRRTPDERFDSFDALLAHCQERKNRSSEYWVPTEAVDVESDGSQLQLRLKRPEDDTLSLTDWGFSQLCRLCEVHRPTVNKLSAETAVRVFRDAMPSSRKPLQVYTAAETALAVHSTTYSRLYDAEVLEAVRDAAPDFTPPPPGLQGATGLYAGEQDMFAFGIDDTAWVEIGTERFAPGFFVWNSEVGRRSVGVQTFWYQAICQNHIVWDATEVVELKRRHTGSVERTLDDLRCVIAELVSKRDKRRSDFAYFIQQAMLSTFAYTPDELRSELGKHGVGMRITDAVVRNIEPKDTYSVFDVVDGLTRYAVRNCRNAGDRLVVDQKAAELLSLAA